MTTRAALVLAALAASSAFGQPAPAQRAAVVPSQGPIEPDFEGVFFRLVAGNLIPLERQTVSINIKAKGFIVANAKAVLDIPGERSPIRFHAGERIDFVVRTSPVASTAGPAAAYHLRQFVTNKHERDATTVTEHVSPIGASVNTTNNVGLLPMAFSRYGASSYKVSAGALAPGEYAIGRANDRTVFCFGVD
jgi:hypothetical protein